MRLNRKDLEKLLKKTGQAIDEETLSKAKGRTKHGNIKVTIDNIVFDSTFEGEYYSLLKLRLKATQNPISNLEVHKVYSLDLNGIHLCNYECDFVYIENGKLIAEDVKGQESGCAYQLFKLKKKLMLAIYSIEVIEITRRK